jgi:hypothetical protein
VTRTQIAVDRRLRRVDVPHFPLRLVHL